MCWTNSFREEWTCRDPKTQNFPDSHFLHAKTFRAYPFLTTSLNSVRLPHKHCQKMCIAYSIFMFCKECFWPQIHFFFSKKKKKRLIFVWKRYFLLCTTFPDRGQKMVWALKKKLLGRFFPPMGYLLPPLATFTKNILPKNPQRIWGVPSPSPKRKITKTFPKKMGPKGLKLAFFSGFFP